MVLGEGYLEGSATTEGAVGATVETQLLPETTKKAERNEILYLPLLNPPALH